MRSMRTTGLSIGTVKGMYERQIALRLSEFSLYTAVTSPDEVK